MTLDELLADHDAAVRTAYAYRARVTHLDEELCAALTGEVADARAALDALLENPA